MEDEILADRLNNEPLMFRGLTNTEFGLFIRYGAMVWTPICLVVAWMFEMTILGLPAAMAMILLTIVVGGKYLQVVKRGRPDFYYQHRAALRSKTNTDNDDFLIYTGVWGIGRVVDE